MTTGKPWNKILTDLSKRWLLPFIGFLLEFGRLVLMNLWEMYLRLYIQ